MDKRRSTKHSRYKIDRNEYFDENIIKLTDDEVFVDCGFYDGETSEQFVKKGQGKYSKIIAFEADKRLCDEYFNDNRIPRLELVNAACWDKEELIFHVTDNTSEIGFIDNQTDSGIRVKAKSIDSVLNGTAATFIKMDIEGAELNALIGAESTIVKYHPKLAISVYHKPEDILEILRYIYSLDAGYKFYIRTYEFAELGVVLYAI